MKRLLFFSIVVFCLAASVLLGSISNALAGYSPQEGDLIKTEGSSAIYYVSENGTRHLFPNEPTFWTWYGGDWTDYKIITVSQIDFDNMQSGKNVNARPGVDLVKFQNSEKVYAVTEGNKLCHVKSMGYYSGKKIITIQNGFENDYSRDSNCVIEAGSKYPDGTLIVYENSNDVYYIDGDKKRKLIMGCSSQIDANCNAFGDNGFSGRAVVSGVYKSVIYEDGPVINGYESHIADVVKNNNEVIVDNQYLSDDELIISNLYQIRTIFELSYSDHNSYLEATIPGHLDATPECSEDSSYIYHVSPDGQFYIIWADACSRSGDFIIDSTGRAEYVN